MMWEIKAKSIGAFSYHEMMAVIDVDLLRLFYFTEKTLVLQNCAGIRQVLCKPKKEEIMRDAFSDCHPVVNFIFYTGAFIMGMCFVHPAFLACSLILAIAYYVTVKREWLKFILGMLGLFVAMSVLNPMFNTRGETVLFTYLGGRPYTLEALCYGVALAAMFVTIITWFATYNQVMTSDKFLYCFGRLAPSVSLLLTMVLRMVPQFQKKTEQIGGARRCIGKSMENGTNYEKAEHGLVIVSALTSWALEGGVVMADSMRSRGFGAGKRTTFSVYRLRRTDKHLLFLMLVLVITILICALHGGAAAVYTPQMQVTKDKWTVLGMICYFAFLSIPTAMNIMEDLQWRILRSKI